MELQHLLKKQITLAWWQFGLLIGIIIGSIMNNAGRDEIYSNYGTNVDYEYTSVGIFGAALVTITAIAFFVLWILGIINAARINSITKESAVLVVFSVLVLFIAHVITAHVQRNKYNVISGTQSIDLTIHRQSKYAPADNTIEAKKARLRQLFIDGQITIKDYENRIKELEAQETK